MNNDKPAPLGGAPANSNSSNSDKQKDIAKNIILGEIDRIFDKNDGETTSSLASNQTAQNDSLDINRILASASATAPKADTTVGPRVGITPGIAQNSTYANPARNDLPESYNKSYYTNDVRELNQNINWEQYHRAWQNYYQKYYEYYFTQGTQQVQEQYKKFAQDTQSKFQSEIAEKDAQVNQLSQQLEANPNFNPQNAALADLRAKIKSEAVKQGRKLRKSKHFVPVLAAVIVVLVFLFLQYNQILVGQVMAYIAPGNMSPDAIVIDPTISINVSEEPKLIIPVLNIEAPVAYDVPSDNASTLKAMENGLAHYCIPGACGHPGEIANTVISGHRTNGIYQTGDYKFIFLKLDQLKAGDIIYANYKGTRYTYYVTSMEIVAPTDVHKVVVTSDKPTMTLVTCTPIGSDAQRILVHAEQIAPDPAKAKVVEQSSSPEITEIPGQTKSFWESVFN